MPKVSFYLMHSHITIKNSSSDYYTVTAKPALSFSWILIFHVGHAAAVSCNQLVPPLKLILLLYQ